MDNISNGNRYAITGVLREEASALLTRRPFILAEYYAGRKNFPRVSFYYNAGKEQIEFQAIHDGKRRYGQTYSSFSERDKFAIIQLQNIVEDRLNIQRTLRHEALKQKPLEKILKKAV